MSYFKAFRYIAWGWSVTGYGDWRFEYGRWCVLLNAPWVYLRIGTFR